MKHNGIVIIDKLTKEQQYIVSDEEKKTFLIFLFNGKSGNGKVKIIIKGKQANVQVLGIILGYGEQKIELFTLQDHQGAESKSDLLIKSVLFNKAKLSYRGLIRIERNAQKSDAYQKNQTILMSSSSRVNTKPYLEILANDVRCTHGATLSPLDKGQLYYLTSRGIEERQATKLLINGFFQNVLQRIPDKIIRSQLEKKISDKLNKLLERSNY